MKKRITDNTCGHDFEINQIVKVDKIDEDGVYVSDGWYFDNDDCEDFDDYRSGDKVRIKQDTYVHSQDGNLVTIETLAPGYCEDGSRSYMTEERKCVPERDFDCYEGETYVNKKETKTMKYKVNDKVKIVACNHGHGFEIGEFVRITEVTEINYRAEYLDGHDYWYVEDDEIAPIPETTIITRPHDYTGCDPEIAEISESSETAPEYKIGDIVEVVAESFYHSFKKGDVVEIVKYDITYNTYRCKRLSDDHIQWLGPDDIKHTSKPQTATVVHKSNYHLHPGEKVTVVKSNEVGNFFCESESGIRIWMQPYQLKFD